MKAAVEIERARLLSFLQKEDAKIANVAEDMKVPVFVIFEISQ